MKYLGWFIISFLALAATAQERLVVPSTGATIQYATKIMTGPQALSSVADQYNVPLSVLAKSNNVNSTIDLRKGEEVRIPLTRDNFFQRNIIGKFQPVYHIFKAGETLATISIRYNKISIDTLRSWNNLPDEIVVDSKALVVGFVLNKKATYSTASYQAIAYDTIPNPNIYDAAKFGPKEIKGELKPVPVPVPKPPVLLPVAKTNNPTDANNTAKTAANNSNNTFPNRKPTLVVPTLVQTEGDFSYRPRSNDEGFFAHTYYVRIKDRAYQAITGDASTFKTISGWNDRKFYVLINEIIPGTIVRITSANNKSVCAKVLGPLPETKGAAGLVIRMNNAAAAALGVDDQRFIVTITYVEY
ncbi:MAG: LysM peptidoglycan-binding domain-containing protein [Bacteroidetes bacterium]|nr:LysM peptidoglycan-binding domain-containing protein [Bacteroidota bacterium]